LKYLTLLALGLAAVGANAQVLTPATGAPVELTVATTPDDSNRLRVAVSIDNQSWHFLIDTASTRSVIASDVADKLNLRRGADVRVQNIGGVDKSPSAIIPELLFSGIVAHDLQAPVLAHANLGGEGLLGLDMLKNKRMTIDFRHDAQLTIAPSSRQPDQDVPKDEPGTIVVVAKSRFGQLIVTDAEIEGRSVSVIIDTGSEDSIGNGALRRLVSGRIAHTEIKPVALLSVTGRTLPADFTQIGRVRIGSVEIANLPVAFADAATFKQFGLARKPAILLGMQTLRLFEKVTIDFPRREIRFVMGSKREL
jgi:predicted aspartyl protease